MYYLIVNIYIYIYIQIYIVETLEQLSLVIKCQIMKVTFNLLHKMGYYLK